MAVAVTDTPTTAGLVYSELIMVITPAWGWPFSRRLAEGADAGQGDERPPANRGVTDSSRIRPPVNRRHANAEHLLGIGKTHKVRFLILHDNGLLDMFVLNRTIKEVADDE